MITNIDLPIHEVLSDSMGNEYAIVISSLLELLFILIPVVYVGKYLKKPKLNDRLRLLGFTTKGYEKIEQSPPLFGCSEKEN